MSIKLLYKLFIDLYTYIYTIIYYNTNFKIKKCLNY